jgi:hypothetical protein
MADTASLVERLRASGTRHAPKHNASGVYMSICDEAADALEAAIRETKRLEAERADQWRKRRDAEGDRDAAYAACDTLRAERDAAIRERDEAIGTLRYCEGCWSEERGCMLDKLSEARAEVERLREALRREGEECAKIAEADTDWTLFQRQSKPDPLSGKETNVFAGPDDDGTYPTAKNVFAYTTGLAAGRAIAAAIRRRAALQQKEVER